MAEDTSEAQSQNSYRIVTLQQRCAYIRLEDSPVKRMLISYKLKKALLAQKIVLAAIQILAIFILNNHWVSLYNINPM